MGNVGRFVCVGLPFALTVASLIALLVAALAGVTDKNLFMFRVNTTNLSISPASVIKLVTSRSPEPFDFHDAKFLEEKDTIQTTNITAQDLGLGDVYDVSLWGFCATYHNGTKICSKMQYNWAEIELNTTKNTVDSVNTMITLTGKKIALPKEVNDAINAFGAITRWTEIVFIIALLSLAIELFFGIFASCSRVLSCLTWLIAGVATLAVIGAASMATAMSVVVVGTVEGTAKFYGVQSEFNTRYLATVWISVAFAIAAGFFWFFTICCCKPDHSRKNRNSHEKAFPPTGSYQPINEHHGYPHPAAGPQYGYGAPAPSRVGAYEPYSHGRV
jgi:hypothetical protein